MSEERNITMVCHGELDEQNEHGNQKVCDTELSEEEHGQFLKHPRGEDRFGNRLEDRFQMGCIRLTCPDCGTVHHVCNMCFDADGANGWYRGESTGEMLACDNCNHREAARQRQDPYR